MLASLLFVLGACAGGSGLPDLPAGSAGGQHEAGGSPQGLGAADPGAPSPVPAVAAPQRSVAELVNREVAGRTALLFTTVGCFLLLGGAFVLRAWLVRWDGPNLAMALLAFVMALHTVALSGVVGYVFPGAVPPAGAVRLEAASYLLLVGVVACLVWAFFPAEFAAWRVPGIRLGREEAAQRLAPGLRRLHAGAALLVMASSGLLALVAAVGPPDAVAPVRVAARWVAVGALVVAVAVALAALARRRALAHSFAAGLPFVVVGVLYHARFGGEGSYPYAITFSVLAFALVQAFALAWSDAERARRVAADEERLRREVARRMKELRAAAIAAHAANLAKGRLLTAVSHELRTPLTSMLGYTQLLKEELVDVLAPRQHEFFGTIQSSGGRLLGLINDLLDLARVEAGHLDLHCAAVDVARVAEDVRRQLYPLAREKALALVLACELPGPRVHADEQRLRQVLVNLVSNALKFTEQGQVTVRITAAALGDGPAVAIAVQDTGRGISPEFIPHLFDRFTQEYQGPGQGPAGTGIGLALSRELVVRMEGELRVESRLGEGSTFTVVLRTA